MNTRVFYLKQRNLLNSLKTRGKMMILPFLLLSLLYNETKKEGLYERIFTN